MSLFQQLAKLRRRHEALVHPFAQISAEPFARQLSTEPAFLAAFVNQRPDGSELNANASVTLVVNNLLVVLSTRMGTNEYLPQLTDFVPAEFAFIDQIQQLA